MSGDKPTPAQAARIYKEAYESGPPDAGEKIVSGLLAIVSLGLSEWETRSPERAEAEDQIVRQAYFDRVRDRKDEE